MATIGFLGRQPHLVRKLGVAGFVLMIAGITINIFPPSGRILFILGLLIFAIANQPTKALQPWGFWLWLIGAA